jgi:hypothetical protein
MLTMEFERRAYPAAKVPRNMGSTRLVAFCSRRKFRPRGVFSSAPSDNPKSNLKSVNAASMTHRDLASMHSTARCASSWTPVLLPLDAFGPSKVAMFHVKQ